MSEQEKIELLTTPESIHTFMEIVSQDIYTLKKTIRRQEEEIDDLKNNIQLLNERHLL